MGISLETMRQIEALLQPLANRQRNMISRAQLLLVDDGKQLQSLQVAAPETVPDGEHFQAYGFSSIPLAGAEGIALFPGGDRGHPLVIVMSDRRYRPTGGEPGEVTVYNHTGASITITKDGDIEARPAAGREVFIRDAGGTVDRLVKVSEYNGHTHAPGTFTTGGGGPVTGVSGGAASVSGTQRLRVQ